LGAAMAAVRSQGEFHRVVERSRAMRAELAQLRQAVANVPTRPDELNSQLLGQAVERVRVMILRNPTHGSGWMVQARPTKEAWTSLSNPTHGSGWIVQAQPTGAAPIRSQIPPRQRVDRPSTAGRSPRSIHLQPHVTHRKRKGSCSRRSISKT